MTRKEFLYKYNNLRISEQYWDYGPGILVQVHDTVTRQLVFEHFISSFDIENSLVEYEYLVMVPINNWLGALHVKEIN